MYQRKVLRGEPHYNWGTNKMKKLNLKSKIAGGLLSLIPIGIRAAEVAPALTATTMSQASPQSATTSEVPFTSYLKILGPKALDFKLPKGSTSATVLVGDSSLTIKNNGDSEMPSPVEAVLAYVARTDSNLSPICGISVFVIVLGIKISFISNLVFISPFNNSYFISFVS